MMNIPFLDIIVSLVFIYALLSILVSIVNEMLSYYNEERGELLKDSILKLLADDLNLHYGELFYNHPEIQRITQLSKRYSFFGLIPNPTNNHKKLVPSYISAERFATVVVDLIANQTHTAQKIGMQMDSGGKKSFTLIDPLPEMSLFERFGKGLSLMHPSPLRDTLLGLYERSEGNLTTLETLLQQWFNDYMERVSGWYKTRQHKKSVVIGLAIALLLNVDALHLVKIMSLDSTLRSKLVDQAMVTADNYQSLSDSARQDVATLLGTFSASNDQFKRIRDSVGGLGMYALQQDPSLLIKALQQVHQPTLDSMAHRLFICDSLAIAAREKANQVTGIAGALNIPIGYSQTSAPWSWLPVNKAKLVHTATPPATSGVMAYNERRNRGDEPWTLTKYIIGILISGFTLSVGAPFWFNLLLKLVDIRRAGVKPSIKK